MEQKRKAIGTEMYLVTQMDAISALKIQTKIIKLLGPGAAGFKGQVINSMADLKNFLPNVLPALLENIDDELINEIVLALFSKGVFIEKAVPGAAPVPQVVDFSEHFRGDLAKMWKVAAFIMEVNFSMGELFGSILPTTEKVEETQDSTT